MVDTTPPALNIPEDYTVECSDDMPMDDATATDNCGEIMITVTSETTPGDAMGNYTITRTFTATDDAGNALQATITVQDTTPRHSSRCRKMPSWNAPMPCPMPSRPPTICVARWISPTAMR